MLLRTTKIFGKPKIQRETIFFEGGGAKFKILSTTIYQPWRLLPATSMQNFRPIRAQDFIRNRPLFRNGPNERGNRIIKYVEKHGVGYIDENSFKRVCPEDNDMQQRRAHKLRGSDATLNEAPTAAELKSYSVAVAK